LPHVRLALERLRDSTEAVFGTGHRRLTLSASQTIIDLWLLPRLGRLQALTKAEISIQTMVVGAHDAPQNDVIRIRYGTGDWPHPYRARLYAEEICPGGGPVAGGPRRSIGQCCRASPAQVRDPAGMPGRPSSGSRPRHCPTCALIPICRRLARPRQGWEYCWRPLPLCAEALASGALVRLDPASLSHHESYWLLAGPQAVSRNQWQAIATTLIET
jgi:LysR family glycine cleavage system transcriptional activator